MKIAILSDSHDNIVNLAKALKFINKEKTKIIIHCGDLCAPSILTEVLAPNFKGQIHLVHGNVGDPELLEKVAKQYKNASPRTQRGAWVKVHGYTGKVILDNKKIAFTHFINNARKLAQSGQFDIVFYGHSHKPWEEKLTTNNRQHTTRLVNPGTVGGMFYKATFAIYDTQTNKLELKILELLK